MTYKKFVPGRWKIGQGSLCPPSSSEPNSQHLTGWEAREREPLHWNDEFQRIGSSNIENTRSFLLSESDYKSSERALALLHNIVLGIVGKLKLNWNVLLKLTGRCQIMTFWLETNWFCPVEKESWQHLFSIVWNLKSVWDRENISSMGALALTLYLVLTISLGKCGSRGRDWNNLPIETVLSSHGGTDLRPGLCRHIT